MDGPFLSGENQVVLGTEEWGIIENVSFMLGGWSYVGNLQIWPSGCDHSRRWVFQRPVKVKPEMREKRDAETEGFFTD
jgi:hypothetical protein